MHYGNVKKNDQSINRLAIYVCCHLHLYHSHFYFLAPFTKEFCCYYLFLCGKM